MADALTPEDQADWDEFDRWMSEDDGRECLYAWLTWRNGTFTISEEDAQAKAMERFRLWQSRKHGLAQARANLKLVHSAPTKPKKKEFNLDLKDLIK